MHATKYLLTLLMGMTMASALALPVPAPADAAVAQDAADKNKNKNNNNGNKNANGTKKAANGNKGKATTKANDNCAAAKKLAAGIDDNIKVQKQEQSDVAAIKKIVSSNNPNKGQFDQAKKQLLSTVNKGIQIRENNEKIAPKGNAAISGLGTVAKAQKTELQQSKSLKGTNADMQVIAQLEKEFAGGIDQNKKNKAAALKGC